jgi:hypothetical protein
MAGATTTTLATAIKTVYEPGMRKTFYEGVPFINMFPRRQNTGGDSIDWMVHYAGSDSATAYSEGATPPAAGYQSITTATISHQAYMNVVQLTGHARDAMRNGYYDGAMLELNGGVVALQHIIEEAFVAAIIDAIDDDTTYAGLTRATYGLASDVTAGGSAALTLAMLSEMYETLKLDPRAVIYQPGDHIIVSAPEQLTAYTEVASGSIVTGDAEASGANLPYSQNANDQVLDAGRFKHTLKYNGLPWIDVATMTNTYVFLMRRSHVIIEEARPLTIEPMGKLDDSDRWLLTWNGGFAYTDPYRAGRIEALTT